MCLPAREEPLSLRADGAQSYGLGAPGVNKFPVLSHVYPPLARPAFVRYPRCRAKASLRGVWPAPTPATPALAQVSSRPSARLT